MTASYPNLPRARYDLNHIRARVLVGSGKDAQSSKEDQKSKPEGLNVFVDDASRSGTIGRFGPRKSVDSIVDDDITVPGGSKGGLSNIYRGYMGTDDRARTASFQIDAGQLSALAKDIQSQCGPLCFLVNETKPVHAQCVMLKNSVAEFDTLLQAARNREASYVAQVEEQNAHLQTLESEIHLLGRVIPDLRDQISKVQGERQNDTENYRRANEKWNKLDMKHQNEVQQLTLQLRRLEDENLNYKNELMSGRSGMHSTTDSQHFQEICLAKDEEIKALRKEKDEYMEYSKHLLSIVDQVKMEKT